MTRTVTVTRDAFIAQADGALAFISGKDGRNELAGMWQRLLGNADSATLHIRSFDEDFQCWRGALVATGFYGQYLPIADAESSGGFGGHFRAVKGFRYVEE